MWVHPRMPSIRNHRSMNGPNRRPILAVPALWKRKMPSIMPITTGSTGIEGLITERPSMADVTVIAGVITPSAISVDAPMAATA